MEIYPKVPSYLKEKSLKSSQKVHKGSTMTQDITRISYWPQKVSESLQKAKVSEGHKCFQKGTKRSQYYKKKFKRVQKVMYK